MDLSKLLGELYQEDDRSSADGDRDRPKPAEAPASGPEWSDEARLDRVFASWTPGPPADAPAAEREMASTAPAGVDEPVLGEDLEREADQATGGEDEVAPAVSGQARAWTPSDDDVLPYRRRRGRGGRLSLLRR